MTYELCFAEKGISFSANSSAKIRREKVQVVTEKYSGQPCSESQFARVSNQQKHFQALLKILVPVNLCFLTFSGKKTLFLSRKKQDINFRRIGKSVIPDFASIR